MARTTVSKKTTQTRKLSHVKAKAEWPGAFKAYSRIFSQMKKNPQPAVFFVVTYLIVSIISRVLQGSTVYVSANYREYESIFQLVILLAIPTYALALADRKSLTVAKAMHFELNKYLFMILGAVLFVLAFIVSFLLLIVPVIWAVGWLSLFQFPIVERNLKPVDALKESKQLAHGHKGKVWGIIGVSLLFTIVVVPLVYLPYVNYLVSAYAMFITIISTGVLAALYRNLQQSADPANS